MEVILYGHADRQIRGSAGAAVKDEIIREKLHAATRAWDFLSLALSVTAADLAGHRNTSSDGWTREFEIEISVADPVFWNAHLDLVKNLLGFLTTDSVADQFYWRRNFPSAGR